MESETVKEWLSRCKLDQRASHRSWRARASRVRVGDDGWRISPRLRDEGLAVLVGERAGNGRGSPVPTGEALSGAFLNEWECGTAGAPRTSVRPERRAYVRVGTGHGVRAEAKVGRCI